MTELNKLIIIKADCRVLTSHLSSGEVGAQPGWFFLTAVKKQERVETSQRVRTKILMLPCLRDGRICHSICKYFIYLSIYLVQNKSKLAQQNTSKLKTLDGKIFNSFLSQTSDGILPNEDYRPAADLYPCLANVGEIYEGASKIS